MEETRKQLSRLEVIGAVITVGVLGFWFGIGATLGSKVVNNLEADNKMAEENQVEPQQISKEPQQVTKEPQGEASQAQRVTEEPQRVTTKNPKKVEAVKRLAESNRKKREAKKREQAKMEASGVNQYYGIGSVLALGVIGGLGYYIYQTKKVEQPKGKAQQNNPKPQPQAQPQTNKFEMD